MGINEMESSTYLKLKPSCVDHTEINIYKITISASRKIHETLTLLVNEPKKTPLSALTKCHAFPSRAPGQYLPAKKNAITYLQDFRRKPRLDVEE